MNPQEVAAYLADKGISVEIVNVSAMPHKMPWIEGEDYEVLSNPPIHNVPTRIRDNTGESFTTYAEQGPDQPPPPLVPIPLTEIGFITLCQEAGGMTDAMLVACDADPAFKAMWIKFKAATQIDKVDPRVQAGLTGLNAAGYLPSGVDAVNNAWPVA